MHRVVTDDDSGAVAILVAIMSLVLFGLAALVVDLGIARTAKADTQSEADAAVMGAAQALYADDGTVRFDLAVSRAHQLADANGNDGDWSTCVNTSALPFVPAGESSCVSFDNGTAPRTIRVQVPSVSAPSIFGGVLGYSGSSITSSADASIARCIFCVLGTDPDPTSASALGGANISVQGGDSWFNTNLNSNAGRFTQGTGTHTYVAGTISDPSRVPSGIANSSPIGDPLAPTTITYGAAVPNPGGGCPIGPGAFGAVTLDDDCDLPDGVYTFVGPLSVTNHQLRGDAVTIVLACGTVNAPRPCAPGDTPPGISVSRGATLRITAPDTGDTARLAIYTDGASTLRPGGTATITGTIYAPQATLNVAGRSRVTLNSLVVVQRLTGSSRSRLTVNYQADQNRLSSNASTFALVR